MNETFESLRRDRNRTEHQQTNKLQVSSAAESVEDIWEKLKVNKNDVNELLEVNSAQEKE